ncbi:oxidoreductase, partial [Brevibacillus sp. SIMBA_076]
MLSIDALEHAGVRPGEEVLVTGATGGVGSFAITLLRRLGYHVVASTGKTDSPYLRSLGVETIINRSELEGSVRPL